MLCRGNGRAFLFVVLANSASEAFGEQRDHNERSARRQRKTYKLDCRSRVYDCVEPKSVRAPGPDEQKGETKCASHADHSSFPSPALRYIGAAGDGGEATLFSEKIPNSS